MGLRVLLDNTIRADARVAHLTSVKLEDVGNALMLLKMRPRKAVGSEWKQEQIECLPTIARLAKEGSFKAFTYEELIIEGRKARGTWPDLGYGDLLNEVQIDVLPSPVRRGLFFHQDLDAHVQSKSLIAFVEWIIDHYEDEWLEAPTIKERITQTEIQNLRNVNTLRAICAKVEAKHYGDLFHLWAGHASEVNWLLTTDKKLLKALQNVKEEFLTCHPISPSDFLNELKVSERDPMPFEFGRRYTLQGIPFD